MVLYGPHRGTQNDEYKMFKYLVSLPSLTESSDLLHHREGD